MKLLETLEMIDRVDQLIRLKATGSPSFLAQKLSISERSVRRLISTMKEMGAPIRYNIYQQSYYYEKNVQFRFGFYCRETKTRQIYGGISKFTGYGLNFFMDGQILTVKDCNIAGTTL